MALRHDLQQLADAGLLHAPTMSWPLPWSDIRKDADAADASTLSPRLRSALSRVQQRAAQEDRDQRHRSRASKQQARRIPGPCAHSQDSPREEGELAVTAAWVGKRFAWKLSAGLAASPDDGQEFRPDGSYVAMNLGNWNLSAGYLDRWWGPGWEGSLILSSNARPVPSIGIDRNETRPFTWPVLRWLGPWRFSTFMGQLEDDRDYPETLLFGMRFEIPSIAVTADCREPQRPVVRRGPPLRSQYLRRPADGQRQRPVAGRSAGQPARRVRRALVLARRTRSCRALRAGDRRGRSRLHALQVPRACSAPRPGASGGATPGGRMSSMRTPPAIFPPRHPNSAVPIPTPSTPAAIAIEVGPSVTASTPMASPWVPACCWSA